jgi:hypothetical protein
MDVELHRPWLEPAFAARHQHNLPRAAVENGGVGHRQHGLAGSGRVDLHIGEHRGAHKCCSAKVHLLPIMPYLMRDRPLPSVANRGGRPNSDRPISGISA